MNAHHAYHLPTTPRAPAMTAERPATHPRAPTTPSPPAMTAGGWSKPRSHLFNRETSWLAFNARVLGLAADEEVPLLERVRYLAIFATNLDEFFQVRVAGLADQVEAGITKRSHDGRTAVEQMQEIRQITVELCEEQQRLYFDSILPALTAEDIHLMNVSDLEDDEQAFLRSHFRRRVLPVLTPLAVDPGHPFPFISDLSLNLAVVMHDPVDGQRRFARVKVPGMLDRWVRVGDTARFAAQEDVIATHLDQLFPGMEILEHHVFRITRNADLIVDDEEAADLLAAVEMELRRRRFRKAVRMEVSNSISPDVLRRLLLELDLGDDDLYQTPGPVDLGGLASIADLPRGDLHWPHWQGVTEPPLTAGFGQRQAFGLLPRAQGRRCARAPSVFVLQPVCGRPDPPGVRRSSGAGHKAHPVPDVRRQPDTRRLGGRGRAGQTSGSARGIESALRRSRQHQLGQALGTSRRPCGLWPGRPEDPREDCDDRT